MTDSPENQLRLQHLVDNYGEDPTNLDNLHEDLKPWVEQSETLGPVLRHPLVVQIFPMWKQANQMYEIRTSQVNDAIAAGEWEKYVWLHERPFRLTMLQSLWDRKMIPLEKLREIFPSVWSDAEPAEEKDWESLFKAVRPCTDADKFPEGELTLYRGSTADDVIQNALAWSLSRDTAVWFARRFSPDEPALWTAKADAKDAYAYITARNEDEINIAYRFLRDVTWTAL